MRPRPMSLLDHREFPVLYVDDEPDNLRIFELTFGKRFTVLTASTGEEGLQKLVENPVAVVLSDHRMPEMMGTEFLRRVRQLDEKTIRMLVTAYGDADTLGEAINDGAIYRYIPKPWDPDDMGMTIQRAIETYALDCERDGLLRELTQLNHLSRGLYSQLDVTQLVSMLMDAMHSELGFDGAALLLLDAEGEQLRWEGFAPAGSVVSERLAEIRISATTAPHLVRRLCKGETQLLRMEVYDDLDPPVRSWFTEVSAREILISPLFARNRVIGALVADNRSGGNCFGAEERTLLDGVANQAAIAIDNARMVEDLHRSREQVLRADRLGTLGTLAAGLAHEINNPLVSVHTFLSLAPGKREQSDPEFWEEYHSLATGEVERIRGLVETMAQLGRDDSHTLVPDRIELRQLTQDVVSLLDSEGRSAGVEFELDCDPETPTIVAIRDHVHQVVLNLVLNALHASEEGGRVRVTVGPDPVSESGGACIQVKDTGEGIPPEHLEKIFDPFFTTKDPDQGTGLGLMICHQIVADHGGSLDVQSDVGSGSSFTVRLPARCLASRTDS